MKKQLIFLFLSLPFWAFAQIDNSNIIDEYLNQIRHNPAQLRAFFQHMPKGGDLHHHYSGSIYAETYIETVVEQNLWVNIETFEISEAAPFLRDKDIWSRVSELVEKKTWEATKEEIIKRWSVKYYTKCNHLPPDQHFFASFPAFGIPSSMHYIKGLNELKVRAKNENLHYIESMLTLIPYQSKASPKGNYNSLLRQLQNEKNKSIQDSLEMLATFYLADPNFKPALKKHNRFVDSIHQNVDDDQFTMRYQNFILRVLPPVEVFKSLLLAFASANESNLIVGVNIVAPENNAISMQDYWLHMQMFKYCHSRYPNVKYAMHAGELTLGLVKPEELSWHIGEAVQVAGANRIGHGVDIPYEKNRLEVLQYMKENKIAIEINLTSNEFILGVKGPEHPISIYKKMGVPIVISTDDAGVLRSDLTHQYVLLANRYTDINYPDIKRFSFNAIDYSFLDKNTKKVLRTKLEKDFKNFEALVLKEIGN